MDLIARTNFKIKSVLLTLLLSALVSCNLTTTRPVQEMANADVAIKASKDLNADSLVPETYRKAVEEYFKAKRDYRLKNFDNARKHALQATHYAEIAEFEAYRLGGATPEASQRFSGEGATPDADNAFRESRPTTSESEDEEEKPKPRKKAPAPAYDEAPAEEEKPEEKKDEKKEEKKKEDNPFGGATGPRGLLIAQIPPSTAGQNSRFRDETGALEKQKIIIPEVRKDYKNVSPDMQTIESHPIPKAGEDSSGKTKDLEGSINDSAKPIEEGFGTIDQSISSIDEIKAIEPIKGEKE